MKHKIREHVKSYKTKYEEGLISSEIEDILSHYPTINKDKFNNALRGITCMMRDNEMIIYKCDVELALHCGLENRGLRGYEFD